MDVYEFEVDDIEDFYLVNLANRTCHCGSWDLIGIPCKHAVACIVLRKLDAKDFVHEAGSVCNVELSTSECNVAVI